MKKTAGTFSKSPRISEMVAFFERNQRSITTSALILAILVFVVICVSKIGIWSVWFDESFSVFIAKQNFADIWHYTALDVNAPLYYFLLRLWGLIFGFSDVALRSLSVVAGVGVIIVGFFLARKLFGNKAGYLSIPLLTLSPMLLRYSTEMRCYTFLVLLLLISTLVFVSVNEKPSRRGWLLYGVVTALALWTHYYAALVILAQMVYRLWLKSQQNKIAKEDSLLAKSKATLKSFFDRDFTIGLIVAVALFLPWLPNMIKQFTTLQAAGFWIPSFSLDKVGDLLTELLVYQQRAQTTDYLAVMVLVITVLTVVVLVKSWSSLTAKLRRHIVLSLNLLLLPIIVLALASLPPLRPMFINRYVIFSMIFFAIFMAGICSFRAQSRRLAVAQKILYLLMLIASVVGLFNILHYGNYNFDTKTMSMAKQLMSQIDEKSSEQTAIVSDSTWLFYDADVYATEKNPVYFLDIGDYPYGSLEMLKDDYAHKIIDLASFAESGQKVWYISSDEDTSEIAPVANWKKLETIKVTDPIGGEDDSNATLYLVQ